MGKKEVPLWHLFPKNYYFMKQIPRECFTDHHTLDPFNSNIMYSIYPHNMYILLSYFTPLKQHDSSFFYFECLLGVVLGEQK